MKTMNELAHKSADDVLKAFECCERFAPDCDECPYHVQGTTTFKCSSQRINDAVYYVYQYKMLTRLMPSVISTAETAVKKGRTVG